jgi:putative acetyltransferase
MVSLRPATPADHPAIRRVVRAAFDDSRFDEASVVEGCRAEGAVVAEWVAEDDGEIVGHILFNRMTCDPPAFIVGLGPLAVRPDCQGMGIGAALSRAGLEICRGLGADAAVVLGHPDYYPRFGYSAAAAENLRSPFSGRPAFMALAFVPDALATPRDIAYPAAFG